MKEAFDAGKTVIVFLPELEEVFVDSGRREYSGTRRNQKTTHLLDSYDYYKALPVDLLPISTSGRSMELTPTGNEFLAPF